MIQIYIIAGLVALAGIMGTGLYKQVQANGIYKANVEQMQGVIDDQHKQFIEQLTERKRVEALLVDNQGKKQVIVKNRDVIKYVIKEVEVNANDEDCINDPVPDVIGCLFSAAGCEAGADRKTIPATEPVD